MEKKNNRVSIGAALAVISLALAAAAALVLFLLPDQPQPPAETLPTTQTQPMETNPTEAETQPTEAETQPPVTLPQLSEGSYEQWLAAAGTMAAYLAYPETTDAVAYFLSETPLENKGSSPGIYLQLTVGGETVLLRLKPLEGRRSEAGTRDISSMQTGYATYDEVAPIDLEGLPTATMEELAIYLNEILLPSLYEN